MKMAGGPILESRIQHSKKRMLECLEKTLGIVSSAAKKAEIDRGTFYEWMKNDSEFKAQVEALKDVTVDFAESKLLENISNNDVTSIIFYLKTQGRLRGYSEKVEIATDSPLIVTITGPEPPKD